MRYTNGHKGRLLSLLLAGFLAGGMTARADTYTVTSMEDDGPGTLRQAIVSANAHAGADIITFNIPPAGVQTISLQSPLPPITDSLTVDGTTQPGYAARQMPVIEIDGSGGLTSDMTAFTLNASTIILRALAINRCGGTGILLVDNAKNCVVERCYIGTDLGGILPLGNTVGVTIRNASDNTIRNCTLSGNAVGVSIEGTGARNKVQTSRIGTDISGSASVGNLMGVAVNTATDSIIENNLVSGNGGTAVSVAFAANTIVRNNFIGLDVFLYPLPNFGDGVEIWESTGSSVKDNGIATCLGAGISLHGANAKTNKVEGNLLLANGYGIDLYEGASQNTIGGATPPLTNTIMGSLVHGVNLSGETTSGNTIRLNDISANGEHGVAVFSSNNTIQENIITDNAVDGVHVGVELDMAQPPNRVAIKSNSLLNNGDLGIRQGYLGGVKANNGQPAPVLSLVLTTGTKTTVTGTLQAAASKTYSLQFFVSPEKDPSGFGEGEVLLGTLNVTTNSAGTAIFNQDFNTVFKVFIGQAVSATAMDSLGNTSDFSNALEIGQPNPLPTLTGLSPDNARRNDPGFTLTVTGTNYVNGSAVRWNGIELVTTFVSATKLTAVVPASNLLQTGTAIIDVLNPPPGGGTSNNLPFTVNNPVPTLSSLSKTTAPAGSAGFTLTINGNFFVSGAIVRWNGVDHNPDTVTTTQITVTITAVDLALGGVYPVTVVNPAPGGGESSALQFSVTNPVPVLTSLSDDTINANNPDISITLRGTNFVPASLVRWGGANRTTSYVSPTQLIVLIPASDLTTPGTFNITVFNPTPGGGTSGALPVTVVGLPQIALTSATAARVGGNVEVTFVLKNVGTAKATTCKITVAKLGGTNTNNSPALPLAFADLNAGASTASLKLTFPGTVTAGNKALSLTVTASGKSLNASRIVNVP